MPMYDTVNVTWIVNVDNFDVYFAGAETLDPANHIRVDPSHVCRHQRADQHRGGVLQQQELQEGYLLPQGGERQQAKYQRNQGWKFLQVVRDTKQTLLFLLFLYCPSVSPKVVLKRKDLGKEVRESERPIRYKTFTKT